MPPLRELTTLKTGGVPEKYFDIETLQDLLRAREDALRNGRPYDLLGGGSNVLAVEVVPGYIFRLNMQGVSFDEDEDTVSVSAGAGVEWDSLVRETVTRGLWGLENLSGIPGHVGATPIQNVGAYGSEVKDTIEAVHALDLINGRERVFSKEECAFVYRGSMFGRAGKKYAIYQVLFRLHKHPSRNLQYKDLKARFEGTVEPSIGEIRDAVLHIRASKFPDLTLVGTAGSFFKNPHLSSETFKKVREVFADIPAIRVGDQYKIPLAYVLDHMGLRGFREGEVGLHDRQPIVLVQYGGATSDEIDQFAEKIERRVFEKIGITIEREVKKFPHFAF